MNSTNRHWRSGYHARVALAGVGRLHISQTGTLGVETPESELTAPVRWPEDLGEWRLYGTNIAYTLRMITQSG